jgi:hypothetical protein
MVMVPSRLSFRPSDKLCSLYHAAPVMERHAQRQEARA